MAHGYLHEGYGMWGDYDPDREGRERNRDRDWRDRDRDRDRGFMFEDRARSRRGRDDDDREWFGGRERGEDRGAWESNRDWPQRQRETGDRGMSRYGPEQGGFGGRKDYDRGRRFGSSQDDHYRSWRDRQMQALDSDYADYCREREQQFHQDFDSWRNQRRSNQQPLQTGMTQTGLSSDPSGMRQAENETAAASTDAEQGPMDAATLGTTSGRRSRE